MAKRRGRRRRRQRRLNHPIKIHRIIDGEDFISTIPDEILHYIFSFIPTDLAIRTSVLSRRWRYAWCELPCLNFVKTAPGIEQSLVSYKAPKIMSLHLRVTHFVTAPEFDSWVEFATSRNVEKLSLNGNHVSYCKSYRLPDFFCLSSSLTQLKLVAFHMHPGCTVSWTSLRRLTLRSCYLNDECIANILSGSPVLETLELIYYGGLLKHLDLGKSLSLKRLKIDRRLLPASNAGPMKIVAPHIRNLDLTSSDKAPCTLVDVSSLAEAVLDICMDSYRPLKVSFLLKVGFFQTMVLKMLAKLQNVERLTFVGGHLLQILSLAELCGVPFPTLKVHTLTVQTKFVRSDIPGIARLLQNSPGLKQLITHATYFSPKIEDRDLDYYLILQGLNTAKCWRSKYEVFPTSKEYNSMSGCNDATSKFMISFMELVLANAKTLEKMVVWLGGKYFNNEQWFEELLQMVGTLSHNNNVSIMLKRRPRNC